MTSKFGTLFLTVETCHKVSDTLQFMCHGDMCHGDRFMAWPALIRIVAVAEHSGCFQLLVVPSHDIINIVGPSLILDDVDSAESNHATEESCVLLRLNIILLNDTERRLIALADGINLMASQSTMEVKLPIVIDIADGNCIGIIVVAQQSQRASRGFLQYSYTLLFCKLLTLAPHFTKLTHSDC